MYSPRQWSGKVYFVVMRNCFPAPPQLSFDLKGATANRRALAFAFGGILGWPGSEWGETPQEAPPIRAEWKEVAGEARHTFTHFHLRLKVMTALVPMERQPDVGDFVEQSEFSPADLPTVMRKAYDLLR